MSSYGLEILPPDECFALLASQRLGRVAVDTGEYPAIFPVLFALLDNAVVFRTAPGDKLVAAALNRVVPFEVDEHDDDLRSGWSVLLVGTMEEILDPTDRARAEALGLEPWAGEVRDRYVRIRPEHVSGRRIARPAIP